MVIILTFLGALAFFACMMFIRQKSLRIILATLTGIIFVGSTLLMTVTILECKKLRQQPPSGFTLLQIPQCPWQFINRLVKAAAMMFIFITPKSNKKRLTIPKQTNTPLVELNGLMVLPLSS